MKLPTRRIALFFACLVVLLTAVGLFFFVRQIREDFENHNASLSYFRRAQTLDYQVNETVLRARSFVLGNYDSLVEIQRLSEEICGSMQASGEALLFNYNPAISQAVDHYCEISRGRMEQIEVFKSKNSVLKNSINSFPTLIERIDHSILKEEALDLYGDVLRYCLQPDPQLEKRMIANLDRFLRTPKASGKKFKGISITLGNHARLINRVAKERQELEKKITFHDFANSIDEMREAYSVGYQKYTNKSRNARILLGTLIVTLMIGLIVMFFRLQEAGAKLSDLNHSLELRVQERTQELSQALIELERQQQLIAQSAKMSALGEMAGGIAHEINTPLAAISLTAESLEMHPNAQATPEIRKGLASIIEIVQKISKIVTGLRKFSRQSEDSDLKVVSFDSLMQETLLLCSQKFMIHGIRLEMDLRDQLTLKCIPEQISQVLLNLLNNSYDAVFPLSEKWVRVSAWHEDSRNIIEVSDSGPGVPPEVRDKIMQPFFTTKEIGKGTGIGLSISMGLIAAHKGHLSYRPEAPTTTFRIVLPEASMEASPRNPAA